VDELADPSDPARDGDVLRQRLAAHGYLFLRNRKRGEGTA
jgi:hypothetical protein